ASLTPTAGAADQLTLTALDANNNVATGYTGSHSITFGGAANAPSGTVPTVTNNVPAAVNFGTATAITFTNGVSSAGGSMKLYKVESPTITATDGSISAVPSLGITSVAPGALNNFLWSTAATETNATAFAGTNTLTARDTWNNTITGFDAGATNVTITGNSPLTGSITALGSGNTNVLNQTTDFSSGVA